MLGRGAKLGLFALATLSLSGAAVAQRIPEPRNNFHAAVNGMISLCPALVGGGPVPDAPASAPFGLRPISSPAGEHHFQGLFNDGLLEVHFEPAEHMCIVHYMGPGFYAVAGIARDIAAENGFIRILSDSRDGRQGEVFQRTLTEPAGWQRYSVLEDPTRQAAAISYSERTNP
jgi:hypothetical protein